MLGLPDELLAGGEWIKVDSAQSLYRHPAGFYRHETLRPRHKRNYALIEVLFGGVKKPVFTTASAHNYLITLGEVLAMNLLAWSPTLWPLINLDPPNGLDVASQSRYGAGQPERAGRCGAQPLHRSPAALRPLELQLAGHPTSGGGRQPYPPVALAMVG